MESTGQHATLHLVFYKDMHSLRISVNQPVGRKHWPNPHEHTHSLILLFKLLMSLLLLLSKDRAIMLIVLLVLISKREWSKPGNCSVFINLFYVQEAAIICAKGCNPPLLGKFHWPQTYLQESLWILAFIILNALTNTE